MAMSAEYRSLPVMVWKLSSVTENPKNKQTKPKDALVSTVFHTHPFHIDKVQS